LVATLQLSESAGHVVLLMTKLVNSCKTKLNGSLWCVFPVYEQFAKSVLSSL